MTERGHSQYRKVQRPKGTAVLTVGKFIPPDWTIVLLEEFDGFLYEQGAYTERSKGETKILVITRVI